MRIGPGWLATSVGNGCAADSRRPSPGLGTVTERSARAAAGAIRSATPAAIEKNEGRTGILRERRCGPDNAPPTRLVRARWQSCVTSLRRQIVGTVYESRGATA